VIVLDKVVAGWGGKANKGGGNIAYVEEDDGWDRFLDFHVHNVGEFLEDQELLLAYGKASRGNLERLERWGVHIYRDDAGRPKYVRWMPEHPWRMAVPDQDITLNMARHTRALGVRFQERVEIVDLLKNGERVCGAIGFGMLEGECVIVKAGAVVLANGNQCYRLMRRWASARGEGTAAAYRAGAAMRGAEFGNFINWIFCDTREVCQGAEDVLYNAKGENISKAVRPAMESDVHSKEVVAWWNEMRAGNGPICANMAENYVNNVVAPAFHEDKLALRPDRARGPRGHGARRLQHLQKREEDERGARPSPRDQGAVPHARRGRPALPGRLPRGGGHGPVRGDVLPRLSGARGDPRLAPA
jgi:succinate dehydrogenase / fumarate reductase, flavoprotein subunit